MEKLFVFLLYIECKQKIWSLSIRSHALASDLCSLNVRSANSVPIWWIQYVIIEITKFNWYDRLSWGIKLECYNNNNNIKTMWYRKIWRKWGVIFWVFSHDISVKQTVLLFHVMASHAMLWTSVTTSNTNALRNMCTTQQYLQIYFYFFKKTNKIASAILDFFKEI